MTVFFMMKLLNIINFDNSVSRKSNKYYVIEVNCFVIVIEVFVVLLLLLKFLLFCYWSVYCFVIEVFISVIITETLDVSRIGFVIVIVRHVGVLNLWYTLRATTVLLYSGIVNGHQLLCDAHTLLEPHMGTAALFLFYSLLSFSTFSFSVCHSDSPISFLLPPLWPVGVSYTNS